MMPTWKYQNRIWLSAFFAVLLWIPGTFANEGARELSLVFDATRSKIDWTLPATGHTVHGTFALKRGSLRIDERTGRAGGEIVVDATSGQSGNDSRDKNMHQEVLESARYGDILFRPDHVDGSVPAQGSALLQIHGAFVVRGSEHEMTIPVQVNLSGNHWKGSAKFAIPYVQWGLKDPSRFLLHVDPTVQMTLEMSGAVHEKK